MAIYYTGREPTQMSGVASTKGGFGGKYHTPKSLNRKAIKAHQKTIKERSEYLQNKAYKEAMNIFKKAISDFKAGKISSDEAKSIREGLSWILGKNV